MTPEEAIAEQVKAFFTAAYGPDFVFRAPETYPPIEQWMSAVACGNIEWAGTVMGWIVESINRSGVSL